MDISNKIQHNKTTYLNDNSKSDPTQKRQSSDKSNCLNTEKLDDAMQELIDICQLSLRQVNDESKQALEQQGKETNNLITKKLISKYTLNKCDTNQKDEKMKDKHEMENSIEILQQKQTELQIQLDEVLKVSKKLNLKQKHKLNRIMEDEDDDDEDGERSNTLSQFNDDEDELFEFQKIENELRISDINRQMEKIQEELRIRLYKRLLSNTNCNFKQNKNNRSRPNRRGSQTTDESSPSSSSCSEDQPTTSSASTINDNSTNQDSENLKHETSEIHPSIVTNENPQQTKKLACDLPKSMFNGDSSLDSSHNHNTINNSKNICYNISNDNHSLEASCQVNQAFQHCAVLQTNSIVHRNGSSINSDLERIEEDEAEDDQDYYSDSNHFRTIYEEKFSPILQASHLVESNYKTPKFCSQQSHLPPSTSCNNQYGHLYSEITSNGDLIMNDINVSGLTQINEDNNSSGYSSYTSKATDKSVVSRNEQSKQNRPLTIYLPNPNQEIDLVEHIQTLGHDLNILSNELKIEASEARGYLWKSCSNNNKRWLKRYFHFNRNSKVISYFDNEAQLVNRKKRQPTAKEIISFNEVCDVYVDHKLSISGSENNKKSKKSYYVFVLATIKRKYLLSARRAEIMRAWIDIFYTAAGANEYFNEFSSCSYYEDTNENNDGKETQDMVTKGDLNAVGLSTYRDHDLRNDETTVQYDKALSNVKKPIASGTASGRV